MRRAWTTRSVPAGATVASAGGAERDPSPRDRGVRMREAGGIGTGRGEVGAQRGAYPMKSVAEGRIMAVSAESTVRNATIEPIKRPTNVWIVSTAAFSFSVVSRS